jgi:K+/H+ antiporter YhaU regulatory subunit KhtT
MRVVLPDVNVLEKLDLESCWIREGSPALDQSVGELNLRATTGATLVAVRRSGKLHLSPGSDFRLLVDDIAFLIGDRSQVNRAVCLLDPAVAKLQRLGQDDE